VYLCACTKGCNTVLMMQKTDDSPSFDRTWNEFKNGFGVVSGDYWLGNEQIHQLTTGSNSGKYKLRVDVVAKDPGAAPHYSHWAEFTTFSVGDEASNYQLTVNGYTGDAGDLMGPFNGMQFTTKDNDNDPDNYDNCATRQKGGFWFDDLCGGGTCVITGGGEAYSNPLFYCETVPPPSLFLVTAEMLLVCND